MGFFDKILHPFKDLDGKTNHYQDISKDSKQVAPNSPSELYLRSRDIAGIQLQEKIIMLNDCHWVRTEYTYPSFDDMNFMYKTNIFSVIVDIQDSDSTSYLPDEFIKRQLYTAKTNNLIPCKFPVIVPNPQEPDFDKLQPKNDGWNLFHTSTNEPVIPEAMENPDKIELSEWEMRNFGIRFIVSHLHAKKINVLGFQDTLVIDPQIWFEDETGKKCWMLVRCENYTKNGVAKPDKLDEITRRCFKYDGYFAGIMIEPKNSSADKIYRGEPVRITFNGIEKIHSTI